MFCPKCGSLLRSVEKDGKRVLGCSCGYVSGESGRITEKVKEKKGIEIINDDKELETLPTTDIECPKCKNKKCYFWLVQTRASDEPETKFLKCTKCKHTFRDYS